MKDNLDMVYVAIFPGWYEVRNHNVVECKFKYGTAARTFFRQRDDGVSYEKAIKAAKRRGAVIDR